MKRLTRRAVAALGWTLLLPTSARANPPIIHDLATLPPGAVPYRVMAEPANFKGRKALRVALAEALRNGRPGVDFGDTASFVLLPIAFRSGTIEVDVLGRLLPKAPADARAFAGLAYRIADDKSKFESVYLRPLNGLKTNPTPPRDKRAVQYFAYPDWRFGRLREVYPDGRYEAGANIAGDEWITLKLDIGNDSVRASVNGTEQLVVREPKAAPMTGAVGLWVDIGTEGYFSNLRVTQRT